MTIWAIGMLPMAERWDTDYLIAVMTRELYFHSGAYFVLLLFDFLISLIVRQEIVLGYLL
tara:strand:- start:227 stop:406 length:180 start_codon:yes stop_codon:yes gene_type:complete